MLEFRRIPLSSYAAYTMCAIEGQALFIELGEKAEETVRLAAFDLSGAPLWNKTYDALFPGTVKAAEDALWLCDGKKYLYHIDQNGATLRKIRLPLQDNEFAGDFIVLKDCFIVCTRKRDHAPHTDPRVMRLTRDGRLVWVTVLPVQDIAFSGVVTAELKPGEKAQFRPSEAWIPRDWRPDLELPLLANRNRLLVSYTDFPSSGIGKRYGLDMTSGKLLWTTPERPMGTVAFTDKGQFLIGAQGYGTFDTWLYNPDGDIQDYWKSHGDIVLSESGTIHVVEMENVLPAQMHFVVLEAEGELRKGPPLDGYYTAPPCIDQTGLVVFWREGRLISVDAQLNLRVLYTDDVPSKQQRFGHMLLPQRDTLAFCVNTYDKESELCLINTPIAPLAMSAWPCYGGNLGTNPVYG